MKDGYMGLDIGTTSVKCMLMDYSGSIITSHSVAYPSTYPQSGWVEQNPEDWITAAFLSIRLCLTDAYNYHIAAISFSGHMSSPVFLDSQGTVLAPCITVADSRCEKQVAEINKLYRDDFVALTGNEPMTWAVAPKLLWMKENHPEVYNNASIVLCAKDYVRYRLTGSAVTDITDVGNWLLYDYKNEHWNDDLINRLDLKKEFFPSVVESNRIVGTILPEASQETGLKADTPVLAGAADMACSQLASGAAIPGCIAITLGTSGQVCMRVDAPQTNGLGKVTFHPGIIPETMYVMASIFSGGLSANWLYRLIFGKAPSSPEDFKKLSELSEHIQKNRDGQNPVVFLPFLTGSGSPRFRQTDRAAFIGLGNDVTHENLLEAVMEGVAFNILDNMEVLRQMSGGIKKITLAGGGTNLKAWPSIIADVVGHDIDILQVKDVSAYGACLTAHTASMDPLQWENSVLQDPPVAETIHYSPRNHMRYLAKYQIYQKLCLTSGSLSEDVLKLCEEDGSLYKVVIITEDSLKAEQLSNCINWETIRCRIAGTASDGKNGLEIIKNEKPDLIVFDIRLSSIDGLNVIAAIKSEFPTAQIAILTKYGDLDYAQKALNLGATHRLIKPLKTSEFLEAVTDMVHNLDLANSTSKTGINTESFSEKQLMQHSITGTVNSENSVVSILDANSFIVRCAVQYMEEHYAEKITLSDVANSVYVSHWHLSKLINQYANRSFPDILNGIRIEKAKILLKDPSLRISDVANQVGFQDATHFSRVFKKFTGSVANEYRQQL